MSDPTPSAPPASCPALQRMANGITEPRDWSRGSLLLPSSTVLCSKPNFGMPLQTLRLHFCSARFAMPCSVPPRVFSPVAPTLGNFRGPGGSVTNVNVESAEALNNVFLALLNPDEIYMDI